MFSPLSTVSHYLRPTFVLFKHHCGTKQSIQTLATEMHRLSTIRHQWHEDPKSEIQRLVRKELLAPVKIKIIETFINKHFACYFSSIRDQVLVVIGRAQELKELYKKTHLVFTHGQALQLHTLHQLRDKLIEQLTPSLHNPLAISLRIPRVSSALPSLQSLLDKPLPPFNALDSIFRYELVSVDAYHWNTEEWESALYFLINKLNISLREQPRILPALFLQTFLHYIKDPYICEQLAQEACKIAYAQERSSLIGALYTICIPKVAEQSLKSSLLYRSHPTGIPCSCYSFQSDKTVLDDLQDDHVVYCKIQRLVPQYRLVTSGLEQIHQQVRSFALTGLHRVKEQKYAEQIQLLVSEAHLYKALLQLDSSFSHEKLPVILSTFKNLTAKKNLNTLCLQYLLNKQAAALPLVIKQTLLAYLDTYVNTL